MTRINVAIPARNLTDEHLLAEHREIKRLPFNFKQRNDKNAFNDLPNKFTLGKGHVLFFIDKPTYTYFRYIEIYNECLIRGFNVQKYLSNWNIQYKFWNNLWAPDEADKDLITLRICKRIKETVKVLHYKGIPITKNDAIQILKYGSKERVY